MSRYQLTRRFCNPLRLRDPEYFGRRKHRRKIMRDPSKIAEMKTRPSNNDGQLKDMVAGRSRAGQVDPKAEHLGFVAIGFSFVALMTLGMTFISKSAFLGLIAILSYFAMHWCAIFSRSMSGGTSRLGFVALACYYGMILLWFLLKLVL